MLIKKPDDIKPSEITPESIYRQRRRFLAGGAALAIGAGTTAAAGWLPSWLNFGGGSDPEVEPSQGEPLGPLTKSPFSTDELLNSFEEVTSYNNFYELGTGKGDPKRNAHYLKPKPWSVRVSGACGRPGDYAYEDLISPHQLEERIYRLRCVEAWSMVIPWVGVPMGEVLKRFEPTSGAKYVEFRTLVDPEQMPGQRYPVLDWPYVEGLRMDEAMHPLTIFAVGLYGQELPNQNGAPIRMVVPWKYGFKSIKSIAEIHFTDKQPQNSWMVQQPSEYGFYANVNPQVSHPRWSQARERRIGELFKRETLMFNGYAEQVAGLYSGMDLSRNF